MSDAPMYSSISDVVTSFSKATKTEFDLFSVSITKS